MTVKSVAIIGAGPAGVIAAEVFRRNKDNYDTIKVFEKRPDVGGVW